jgi:UDP-glucose 4-epimerase
MVSLVTGGCGFIGSHIVDKLVSLGHEVRVIDDLSAQENEKFYYSENLEKVKYFTKDISEDDCEKYFYGVDWVFHLAARSRIQPTISSPGECFEVNVVGTQRALEWSRLSRVKKLIYSSTSSLYGQQNATPFNPNMPADCLNPYSMSKWMGEQICKLYYQLYGFKSISLRYFNVYGPREPLKGCYAPVAGLFKRQEREENPITVVGSGLQRRDFTYIDDVVDANICAMNAENIDYGVYNVGTGESCQILELANMIRDKSKIIHIPERQAEVFETLADIKDTIEDLCWQPKYKISDTINTY